MRSNTMFLFVFIKELFQHSRKIISRPCHFLPLAPMHFLLPLLFFLLSHYHFPYHVIQYFFRLFLPYFLYDLRPNPAFYQSFFYFPFFSFYAFSINFTFFL